MKIIKETTKDFGYLQILDFYTEEELYWIWKEISYLDYIMESPLERKQRRDQSAWHENGTPKMTGKGVYINSIFQELDFSSIYTYSRKLFSEEVVNSISETHPSNVFWMANCDNILLNRYQDSQEYAPHQDIASWTGLTVLLHEPENINGGELSFPDYDIPLGRTHNSMILFPSWVSHAVNKLQCSGNAKRYSITHFMNIQFGI